MHAATPGQTTPARHGGRLVVAIVVVVLLAFCAWFFLRPSHEAGSQALATPSLLDATKNPANWVTHGGTYDEQRFSKLAQINASNVGKLGLAWSTELDTNRGQETTPLVVDGRVYLTTAWSKVYALDGKTGAILWKYDPKVPGDAGVKGCCDVVNRGAAYYDGKVYVGTFDGRLVALDANSGQPVWTTNTVDTSKPYTITGAPRVVDGNIVIGNGGAELGVRGYVTAYDAETGAQKWRFYTVPRPDGKADGEISDDVLKAKADGTWFDGMWKQTGGGGTVWDAIVYDPEFDQVYIGVGNGTPWNQDLRTGGKGDNLFLSSIVALDAKTGAYKWHYQVNPGESWDFTASQPIMLSDLMIDGKPRKVLMQAPKNGFFYVIDRQTGKLISAKPFTKVTWATSIDLATGRPVEVPEARYHNGAFLMYPSAFGGHSWYPMSFSPRTGLVYLPVQEVPMFYQRDDQFRLRAGTFNIGVFSPKNAVPTDKGKMATARASVKGALVAWDPVAQREVWRAEQPGPANAGTMATAGDLVFEGNPQGAFQAFDARDGKPLWKFQAQTGVGGSPITYSIDGQQYVLVVSGAGGGFAVSSPFLDDKRAKPNGRVLAFKLGGNATLPAYAAPALGKATAPADAFTDAQIEHGGRIFETTCSWCHGAGAVSGGVLPDLRRSPVLADKNTWQQVVIGGILSDQGMVSFARSQTPADAEAVRAYVAAKSRLLAKQEGAH
jgi:quinohemoprotein ethanol dehydrogenase